MSHRPICSIILDECFRLGVIRTSLIGLKPNNRNICLLNIPIKIVTSPKINQKGNIVTSFRENALAPPRTGVDDALIEDCRRSTNRKPELTKYPIFYL